MSEGTGRGYLGEGRRRARSMLRHDRRSDAARGRREAITVADELQNFIDGKWVDALDGSRFDVFNPATGEVIATASDSKAQDVEGAIDAARRTFDEGTWWPGTSERERGRILLRAAEIVRREQERLERPAST